MAANTTRMTNPIRKGEIMRDKLNYTTMMHGQEVTVTRYHAVNEGHKKRKASNLPVDERLHALDMLLESAKEHDSEETIQAIEASIAKRIKELTGA